MKPSIHTLDDSESIRAYHNRIRIFSHHLSRETDPKKRAITALYLAEAATTLARLESEQR
ncbi:hypothetical protein VB712_14105 [Spirulina sp. CCNP1310]|uniref:hypothetical protein n=1 Tax=Spirulina sp. CCNP1310 TaxID=3110249 RepID=UPI002B216236|nr:hypothetical protein [Spirulina sp. CCNP1310]MEA5420356.1 hypothetical protein [Spirulina sp. CCNP1310]MEA5420361.1 hypothetical protein [Spirulina sp. CCNP1310]